MATKRVTFAGPSEDDGDDVYPDEEYSASMAKKRKAIRTGTVEDDEDTFEADAEKRKDDSKSYHTLDSDEEDNVKYDKLDMRKIHGQEEGTEEYEGDVKITAFNMKEDMEDGHFDSAGNFIFNKTEEIRDGWLDNIDWTQVKRRAGKHWLKEEKEYADDTTGFDKTQMKAIYEKLLGVLQPKESILRAIKRIGAANKLSAAEERKRRWAAKKAGKEVESDETKMVKEVSGLADALVSQGHVEAYQFSREKIEKMMQDLEQTTVAKDSLDMFADDDEPGPSSSAQANQPDSTVDEEVQWEYRLIDDDEAKIHGPFTTTAISKLKDTNDEVAQGFARRVGSEAFYKVARIDFDLYE